ncbi:type II toxin-antitoxin system VapC family toxin [Chelativorans xinjiangense]|uniref:type II toxin-antitoxin system VapC family toxin n=1 Tax=Chelativorans xinjiangense TaxID=2681485 RepID=UPI00135C49B5|nr:type II toxin-antitoxin system VapC family toxin [Chelativorans xinjiangense]
METLVIDASIAVKWVVKEEGTEAALGLRSGFRFLAPELLVAECSNILWKKVQRGELLRDEAVMASRLLERAGIEFVPMRGVLEQATDLAITLSHPAYDWVYLAIARQKEARFVTADQRLLRIVSERASDELTRLCVSLSDVRNSSR